MYEQCTPCKHDKHSACAGQALRCVCTHIVCAPRRGLVHQPFAGKALLFTKVVHIESEVNSDGQERTND